MVAEYGPDSEFGDFARRDSGSKRVVLSSHECNRIGMVSILETYPILRYFLMKRAWLLHPQ